MPNRFTRIPKGVPPSPPAWLRPLVSIGDVFMWAQASRPATGSLARTWVTPATYGLCGALAAGCFAFGGFLLATGAASAHAGTRLFGLALVLYGIGSASVAAIGFWQRRQA